MNTCKHCHEEFRSFDYEEICLKNGRFWTLRCPYCRRTNDLMEIEMFKSMKDYLYPQYVDIGTKTILLKHLKPIAKLKGWKLVDLRKKSYWELRAIYRKYAKINRLITPEG